MARMSAVRWTGIGSELVGCGLVVEERVSPSAAFRKSLAVFFHDKGLSKDVRHIDRERSFSALFRLPLELHDSGAIRERLAVAGNTGLVCLDHGRIGDDDLTHFLGSGGGDYRPVFISLEI